MTQHALTDRQVDAVNQVATLFPYLRFDERVDWVSRLKGWYGGDFAACANDIVERAELISGEKDRRR